ncbi:MmgE/PrpD family protein [Nocardioides halotolerans]|uniref:MmgE/PrpD family protein n=1 Tax=Nocardioides halotolerans TaxID=433660 RepID=UPI000685BF2B|nr:MmgE/PrpD family protein [Nocardioides halotolerans]
MSLADEIAALSDLARSSHLAPQIGHLVTESFVDTLACVISGAGSPAGRLLRQHRLLTGRSDLEARIPGSTDRQSLMDAALTIGTCAHVADFDDVCWEMMGHPSAVLISALLPAGEALGSSGQDLVSAYLVGYEVMVSLGHAITPEHYLRGWHATATCGTLGAAAAIATLLRLDPVQFTSALGIAASQAAGLRQNFGSMVKPFHVGMAARNGLQAAFLGEAGLVADSHALDGESGFLNAFGPDTSTSVHLAQDLSQLLITKYGLTRKQYPSCAATHQAIDAARSIYRRTVLPPERDLAVRVLVAPACLPPLLTRFPTTALERKFSMEFCVASALLAGEVDMSRFEDDAPPDDAVTSLMKRVEVSLHPELSAIPENSAEASAAEVVVTTSRGTALDRERVLLAEGSPANPLSEAALRLKFEALVAPVLTDRGAAHAYASASGLSTVGNVRSLVDALVLPS